MFLILVLNQGQKFKKIQERKQSKQRKQKQNRRRGNDECQMIVPFEVEIEVGSNEVFNWMRRQ